jgi:hypothetical protein
MPFLTEEEARRLIAQRGAFQPPVQIEPQVQQPNKSVGGLLANILKSGGQTVAGIGGALVNTLNPNEEKNTLANLFKLIRGGAQLIDPSKPVGATEAEGNFENRARAVGDFYNQRYGVSELLKGDLSGAGKKAGETLYQDPVGAAFDLAAILGLGGSALTKAGKLGKLESVANVGAKASKLSRVVDPLQAAGRAVSPTLSKVLRGGTTKLEEFGRTMPTKILKANPTRVAKFEETLPKGNTIDNFITENNLVGSGTQATKKANVLIKETQDAYNTLARSKTKTVNPVDYISKIDEEIKNIQSTKYTKGAKQVIAELEKEKQAFMEGVTANKEVSGVPIDKFTNMKTATLGKASKLKPYQMDADRIMGNAMIQTIEQYAPGSSILGKKLQQLREFKSLAERVPTGKNTNLLGILKPSGTGAAIGGIVGGVPGAVIGAGAGLASQNPLILKLLGKTATTIGEKTPKVASYIGDKVSTLEQQGNIARLLTQVNGKNQQNQNNNLPNIQSNNIIPPQTSPISQPQEITQPEVKQNYLTGRSPEEHYQAYQKAIANNDTTAATRIYKAFTDETAYQKANKSKVGNVTSSIDMMEQLYAPGTGTSLSMGKNTVGVSGITGRVGVEVRKQTDQDYVDRLNSYKTQMALVAGAINQAAGAGVLNGGEYERLAMKSFPNEYTSETVAKEWFANARKVLNSLPDDRLQQLQGILGE